MGAYNTRVPVSVALQYGQAMSRGLDGLGYGCPPEIDPEPKEDRPVSVLTG